MASNAFFVPKPAAAPAAPKPTAFPMAIKAGIAMANGNMPPFCRRRRLCRALSCSLRPLLCYPLKYAKPLSCGAFEGLFQRLFLFFCLRFLNNICPSPLIIYFISTSSLITLINNTLHSHSHVGQKTAVRVRRCQRIF